jgi:flagellin-specific chaperone FliS
MEEILSALEKVTTIIQELVKRLDYHKQRLDTIHSNTHTHEAGG